MKLRGAEGGRLRIRAVDSLRAEMEGVSEWGVSGAEESGWESVVVMDMDVEVADSITVDSIVGSASGSGRVSVVVGASPTNSAERGVNGGEGGREVPPNLNEARLFFVTHSFLILSASESRVGWSTGLVGGMSLSSWASCWLRERAGRRPICLRAACLRWTASCVAGGGATTLTVFARRLVNARTRVDSVVSMWGGWS